MLLMSPINRSLPMRKFLPLVRNMHQTEKKPYTIVVEGNIGSGKTTFLNHFKGNKNILTISEPVEDWKNVNGHNLLQMSYSDPKKWAFMFQSYIQLSMTRLHQTQTSKPVKIIERSIYSARYCFVEQLYDDGVFEKSHLAVLDEWFKWLIEREDMTCDLIVYLRTLPEVAYERVKLRNRNEEQNITLDFIQKLHSYHENWLFLKNKYYCPSPVLVLDANKDIEHVQQEYHSLKKEVDTSVKSIAQIL